MKFDFVVKHRGTWPVHMLCDTLGVSRSAFYAWRTRPESRLTQRDAAIAVVMRASFVLSARTYGARRIRRHARAEGFVLGLHNVERLSASMDSARGHGVAPCQLMRVCVR